ncbi:MAG: hypothetical protein Q8K21_17290 [Hydrogenophaga sp.]|uniref:hypothetical protein n=1 Tax=Hydrogenophaga sp. TaxID=1904254 RepID=UPI00273213AB|nr:hypothetical protein [Hydrogenophaga sp.]MDP2165936.1 hypothetical protein [Hydrogenophaga sp.]MDP3476179.1 hypothetical protein [Hydrogenophaga sp.]
MRHNWERRNAQSVHLLLNAYSRSASTPSLSIDDSTGPANTSTDGTPERIRITEGQRVAAARLQATNRKRDGNAAYVLEPVEQVAGAGREFSFARHITREASGIEVTPVSQPGKRIFNGAQVGNHLLLDVNTQEPAMAVMGYELLHEIAMDCPHAVNNRT